MHVIVSTWVVLTRALDESPLKVPLFWAEPGLQHHILAVSGRALHWSAIRTLHALPSTGVTRVPTPAAVRLLQTQTARTQTRAVLSCNDREKKEIRADSKKITMRNNKETLKMILSSSHEAYHSTDCVIRSQIPPESSLSLKSTSEPCASASFGLIHLPGSQITSLRISVLTTTSITHKVCSGST